MSTHNPHQHTHTSGRTLPRATRRPRSLARAGILTALTLLALLACAAGARAAGPVKIELAAHIGHQVNQTETNLQAGPALEDLCTIASKDTCQPGNPSTLPGGFTYPYSVVAAPDGDIYVADTGDNRVQELTASGEFVLMIGDEVNETKDYDDPAASEAERNICTATEIKNSGVKCGPGSGESTPGTFRSPLSIAVDPATEDFYVQDFANWRVEEFSKTGQFILTVGKGVNETKDHDPTASETEKNLCTAASKDTCTAGEPSAPENTEKGAFDFAPGGNLLSVGRAPGDLLYVADHQRIQEFNAAGEWQGAIKLPTALTASAPEGAITALAADPKNSTVYAVYNEGSAIHQFNTAAGNEVEGTEVATIEVPPRTQGNQVTVEALTFQANGVLAVAASEEIGGGVTSQFGLLYEPAATHSGSSFTIPGERSGQSVNGMAFNAGNELYAASAQEVLVYGAPVPVAEVTTEPGTCKPGAETGTDATFTCALTALVDPYKISGTEAWFEYGQTCTLGTSTVSQPLADVEEPLAVSQSIQARPDQSICYRVAGVDQNARPPETLTANNITLNTAVVAPRIVGAPAASFLTASSAVVSGALNPENTSTEYYFQYAAESTPGEDALAGCPGTSACPGVHQTGIQEGANYGMLRASAELSGLQPSIVYHYRLAAINSHGESATGPEETFTTTPLSNVQATTGPASAVTATSATITGSVNPGGKPAVYNIELGVYQGTSTQYGIVLSGSTPPETTPLAESEQLSGLQPGTTYAYRIKITGGYGSATGETILFTTQGLPTVLATPPSLALLPTPNISLPATKTASTSKKHKTKQKTKRKTKRKQTKKPGRKHPRKATRRR